MPDLYHYAGETNPNDIRLSDPTTLRNNGETKSGAAAMAIASQLTATAGAVRPGAGSVAIVGQFSAAAGAIRSGSAALAIASTFSSSANATRSASAAITFLTTWTASAEAIVPGTTKDGAATLAIVSTWTASATLRTTSSGGGYGTARRSRVLPVTPILYIKPAAAKCHIATRWTAAPRTLRAASAGITSKATLHGTACKRAQGSGTTRNRTSATARAHVLRGIGMSDAEALQLLELLA